MKKTKQIYIHLGRPTRSPWLMVLKAVTRSFKAFIFLSDIYIFLLWSNRQCPLSASFEVGEGMKIRLENLRNLFLGFEVNVCEEKKPNSQSSQSNYKNYESERVRITKATDMLAIMLALKKPMTHRINRSYESTMGFPRFSISVLIPRKFLLGKRLISVKKAMRRLRCADW